MHLREEFPDTLLSAFSDFVPCLTLLDWHQRVAVAVSGGGDSMALLASVLEARRVNAVSQPLQVLTVDHKLRAASADEAAGVASFCAQHNAGHTILTWTGDRPASGIAERARIIRRDLLLAECSRLGIRQLLLAHTMDDVAETLLMRVRRGGLRGHASIAPQTRYSQIRVLRPFLSLRRDVLRKALADAGISWVEDPSNSNLRFERPRVRRTLQMLDEGSFTTERIVAYAALMGRWRTIMARQIAVTIESGCRLDGADVQLQSRSLRCIPRLIAVETLRELVRFTGGDAYMIDFAQATQAVDRILNTAGSVRSFSAGRCVMSRGSDGVWTLSRALRDLPTVSIAAGQTLCWDGRFVIKLSESADEPGEIRPHRTVPVGCPEHLPYAVNFRPRVLDGPVACTDEPVFAALSALVQA
uniref:tRNA lysidine(34) synthetase TilS n=1 Tax=Pararhizobium sp. IMCC3301 TaxID=3067904 RepID=UPI00274176C9|nr:tRNA lysidine(34) synthetase TilS [Pararhizobium sp. IMCC3301]